MTAVYSACMTLIIAARFGPYGVAAWTAIWCVLTYRATSSRRSSGGQLTNGERTSGLP